MHSPSETKFRDMADVLVPAMLNSVTVWDGYEPEVASKKKASMVLSKMEKVDESRAREYSWRDMNHALRHLQEEGYIETSEVSGEERFDFYSIDRRER